MASNLLFIGDKNGEWGAGREVEVSWPHPSDLECGGDYLLLVMGARGRLGRVTGIDYPTRGFSSK